MIGEKLKKIREQTGMNKKEFASYIGLKYTTYNNYETGEREPNSDFLIMISKKFDVSVDYIFGLQDKEELQPSYGLKASEYEHIKKYRSLNKQGRLHVDTVLEWEMERIKEKSTERIMQYYKRLVSAGKNNYLFDDIPSDTIKVKDTSVSQKADFVISVHGDSMEPDYFDGEKVFVKKTSKLEIGNIGIFVYGENCIMKELGQNCLISRNTEYPPINVSKDIRLIGKVIGKVDE